MRRATGCGPAGAYLPGLAMYLNKKSGYLADLGRREEALAAIERIGHHPARPGADPARHIPPRPGDRAERPLTAPGRPRAARRRPDRCRGSRHHPARPRGDPARHLPRRSCHGAEQPVRVPRRRRAARGRPLAIEEAVTIRRDLARVQPDTFGPDLATALNNLSTCLADLGRATTPWPRSKKRSPSGATWRRPSPTHYSPRPRHGTEQPVHLPGRPRDSRDDALVAIAEAADDLPADGQCPARNVSARSRDDPEQPVRLPGRPRPGARGAGRDRGSDHDLPAAGDRHGPTPSCPTSPCP